MMNQTDADIFFMRHALNLATKGEFTARPNPCVGCVIVHSQKIVGEGLHWQAGLAHAECEALAVAKDNALQATCYITLEPCVHYGRTGPCVLALISAKVKRVVVATLDPNPLMAGKGVQALQEAGIEVLIGVLEKQAQSLNKGFFSRQLRNRPYVRAKIATSLDGRIAMATGESQWITSEASRAQGHRWRAKSGAILTGNGTVKRDNCRLTVREPALFEQLPSEIIFKQPWRIVVDTQLTLTSEYAIFQQPGKTLVAVSDKITDSKMHMECVKLPEKANHVDLLALLLWMGEQEINDVLVESGATLIGALLQQGLIDELLIYMAPKILGSDGLNMINLPGLHYLKEHIPGNFESFERVGCDLHTIVKLSNFGE